MFRWGPVRAVSDAAELARERTAFRPYGEKMAALTPLTLPESKGYIGERYDDASGLQYLNARYYDPRLGMFLQPDWWEVTQAGVGTNRYSYSFGDPVNGKDPGGNSSRNYDSDGDGVNDSWEHIKVGSARDKQYKEWQAAHSGGSSPLSSLYRELGGGSIGSFDDYSGQPAGGRAGFGARAQVSQFSIAWPRGLLGIPVQVPDATPLVDSIVTTLTLSESNRVWVTYTLRDLSGGMVVYVGRASGLGTPAEVMMRRFA